IQTYGNKIILDDGLRSVASTWLINESTVEDASLILSFTPDTDINNIFKVTTEDLRLSLLSATTIGRTQAANHSRFAKGYYILRDEESIKIHGELSTGINPAKFNRVMFNPMNTQDPYDDDLWPDVIDHRSIY